MSLFMFFQRLQNPFHSFTSRCGYKHRCQNSTWRRSRMVRDLARCVRPVPQSESLHYQLLLRTKACSWPHSIDPRIELWNVSHPALVVMFMNAWESAFCKHKRTALAVTNSLERSAAMLVDSWISNRNGLPFDSLKWDHDTDLAKTEAVRSSANSGNATLTELISSWHCLRRCNSVNEQR